MLPKAQVFVQTERRGTAHAVLAARAAIEKGADDILVIFGDTPLISADTLKRLRGAIDHHASVAVLGFRAANPAGYGRLITNGHRLVAIREDRDASELERRIDLCNGGLMALRGDVALEILDRIGDKNAKGEFYLTDAVAIADGMALEAVALETTEDEVHGINTKSQLADAEDVLQWRLRDAAMEAGVTLIAPETVFLCADTKFGRDVTVEPNVVFGPGVTVEDNAVIHAFSHLEGAHVGKGASVGPFARLRPGTKLGAKSRVGNFVEVKAAELGEGAKANHLAYIGDGSRRRRREHRRRHDLLQLRRQGQAPHRSRQGRVHRLELGAGRAGEGRRQGLCGLRLGDHRQRAGGRARARPRPAGQQGGLEARQGAAKHKPAPAKPAATAKPKAAKPKPRRPKRRKPNVNAAVNGYLTYGVNLFDFWLTLAAIKPDLGIVRDDSGDIFAHVRDHRNPRARTGRRGNGRGAQAP